MSIFYSKTTSLKPTTQDYVKLHFIIVLLGFTAILGRLIEMPALGVVVYRTFIASAGMALLLVFRKKSLRVERKVAAQLIGTGFLVALHWMAFFGSARLTSVSLSLVCFSTGSFFTALIEPLFHRRRISKLEIFLGILVVIGISLIFTFEFAHFWGIIVGLLGALLSSIFSVLNARFAQHHEAHIITLYEMIGAFSTSLVFVLVYYSFSSTAVSLLPSASDWLYLLLLGGLCTVYTYNEITRLLKKISAFTLNLSINMEPVYGILLAFLIFDERKQLTTGFYAGTALILSTVILYPILRKKGRW